MAIIKLAGNKNVNVPEDKAEKIYLRWTNLDGFDRSSVVDLGSKNFVQLGQIKGIDFQKNEKQNDKFEKHRESEKDWREYVEQCKQENAEQKAHRIINSFAKILYNARMNTGEIEYGSELYDNLMIRLIEYFAKNPDEWHAKANIYQDLIPYGNKKILMSSIKGIKTIGQLMITDQNKNEKRKTSCDNCKKLFEYEGERPLFCNKCQKLADRGEINLIIE